MGEPLKADETHNSCPPPSISLSPFRSFLQSLGAVFTQSYPELLNIEFSEYEDSSLACVHAALIAKRNGGGDGNPPSLVGTDCKKESLVALLNY